LGGLALWWIQARRRTDPARPRTVWRWVLAAAVVFSICWTPTFIDQVAHSGNVGKVIEAATERHSPLGPTVGAHAVIRTVGVTPSTPHFLSETLGYTLWSATTIGMFAWLVTLRTLVVLSGAEAWISRALTAFVRTTRTSARRIAVAAGALGTVAAAALAGAVGAAAGSPDEHAF